MTDMEHRVEALWMTVRASAHLACWMPIKSRITGLVQRYCHRDVRRALGARMGGASMEAAVRLLHQQIKASR
jgi:hypothetical protein